MRPSYVQKNIYFTSKKLLYFCFAMMLTRSYVFDWYDLQVGSNELDL
jgi:hypothetical protein